MRTMRVAKFGGSKPPDAAFVETNVTEERQDALISL